MHELSVLLPKMRAYGGTVSTVMGLFLLLLTGVRTGELRLATPDQFDLKKRLWVIPPEVVKQLQVHMRKTRRKPTAIPPYIVPLSHQAVEIVRLMLSLVRPGQRYLFSHRSRLNERISENTLNSALHRLGYADRLTGHGMRATITTALTELGYPQQWIDAQLSHSEPNKVRAAYTHAQYVEQRRAMMQDWANRLDQLEEGRVAVACERLTTSLEGAVLQSLRARGLEKEVGLEVSELMDRPVQAGVHRPVRRPPCECLPKSAVAVGSSEPVSEFQRERAEMLAIYEAPTNLTVPAFAKLAGKSRDQINRDLKAKRLLSIGLGNRGQRIPDWRLDPLRHELVLAVLKHGQHTDSWSVYRALTGPSADLGGIGPIAFVTRDNFERVLSAVASHMRRAFAELRRA